MIAHIVIDDMRPLSKQAGTKFGKKRCYLTNEYKNFKDIVAWCSKLQLIEQKWQLNTVKPIVILCEICWPKNDSGRIGDIDNVVSGIYDALQGVAYKNDKQIYKSTVSRRDTGFEKSINITIEAI